MTSQSGPAMMQAHARVAISGRKPFFSTNLLNGDRRMSNTQSWLVLGVGNLLYGDEGVGVHAVRVLEAGYHFPNSVKLLDGGTLGLSLMGYFLECSQLIVLDCIRAGHTPGSVYRLEGDGLRKSMGLSDSLHQLDLVDTLNLCELSHGYRPETVVFGIEPHNMRDLSIDLTPAVSASLPKLCTSVIDEMRGAGLTISPKTL